MSTAIKTTRPIKQNHQWVLPLDDDVAKQLDLTENSEISVMVDKDLLIIRVKPNSDLDQVNRLRKTVHWPDDPMDIQRQMRSEWDDPAS